jgi:hypothetical protein
VSLPYSPTHCCQARGELSVYHDLPGLATTTLSADVQTSGAAGPASPDMLMVLRVDSQRRGFPIGANNPSVGLMMARLAQECRPHRGPVATGVRLQDCVRMSGPGGAPVELDVALGKVKACLACDHFVSPMCVRPLTACCRKYGVVLDLCWSAGRIGGLWPQGCGCRTVCACRGLEEQLWSWMWHSAR